MKLIKKLIICAASVVSLGWSTSCGRIDQTTNIQILMTSDVHGMLVPWDYALDSPNTKGSLSQISTAVKQYRNKNTLLIDCGDIIQGNYADYLAKDPKKAKYPTHPMIEALNKMKYDVFVTGNHEFNFTTDYLKSQISKFNGTVLCGNVFSPEGEQLADAYKIFNIGGVKVGVIGMVTKLITRWDKLALQDWHVYDPVEYTSAIAEGLKLSGAADVVIAAEHMGVPLETGEPGTSCRELAEKCPYIDVILAAHEHKAYEKEIVNGVLIVENPANAQSLMKVNLDVAYRKGYKQVIHKTSKKIDVAKLKTDPEIDEFAAPVHKELLDIARTPIGTLQGDKNMVPPFEIKKVPATYMQPTPLVQLINEVQLEVAKADTELSSIKDDIKVASTAVGNYDADLNPGVIRLCDASHIYKYSNNLYVVKMKGWHLKKYMEWTASFYQKYVSGDLTIAFEPSIPLYNYDMFTGIEYQIDISKDVGNRIKNLKWKGGNEITDGEDFYMAINHYRANTQLLSYGEIFKKGEELPTLVKSDIKNLETGNDGIREMIGDYIKKKNRIEADWYNDDNWSIIGAGWDTDRHNLAVQRINNEVPGYDIGEHNTIKIREPII